MKLTGFDRSCLILTFFLLLVVLFAGCSGGDDGVSTSGTETTETSGAPSITIEGELPSDLIEGLPPSVSTAPSGVSRDIAAAGNLNICAVDNARFRQYMSAGQSLNDIFKSDAAISGAGNINAVNNLIKYSLNVQLTDNSPNSSIICFDRNTNSLILSTSLGTLPNKSEFTAPGSGNGTVSATVTNNGTGKALAKNIIINGSGNGGITISGLGSGSVITNNGSGTFTINLPDGSILSITGSSSAAVTGNGNGTIAVNNIGMGTLNIDNIGSGSVITNNSGNTLT